MTKMTKISQSKENYQNQNNLETTTYFEVTKKTEQNITQPNQLTQSIYRCSGYTQKLFILIISEFMKNKKTSKDRWISIGLTNTISDIGIKDGKNQRTLLKNACDEMASLFVRIEEGDNKYYRLNLIEELSYNYEKNELKYKLSEKFATFLEIEHKNGFTVLSVKSISKLQSFYAMRYYELAMSFYGFKGKVHMMPQWAKNNNLKIKSSWFFAYSIQQLKELFCIDENQYRETNNFVKRIVQAPIEELNEKIKEYQFKIQICRKNNAKRGKIDGFIFWVTEINKNKKKHDQEIQQGNLNKQFEEIKYYKQKYPEEFKKALEQVDSMKLEIPGMIRMSILKENDAMNILKEKGL